MKKDRKIKAKEDDHVTMVYVSQPEFGLSDDEVATKRNEAIREIKKKLGDDTYILDAHFTHMEVPNISKPELWRLGDSIIQMSFADYVYYVKGWKKSRKCELEHLAAVTYGVQGIYEDDTSEGEQEEE